MPAQYRGITHRERRGGRECPLVLSRAAQANPCSCIHDQVPLVTSKIGSVSPAPLLSADSQETHRRDWEEGSVREVWSHGPLGTYQPAGAAGAGSTRKGDATAAEASWSRKQSGAGGGGGRARERERLATERRGGEIGLSIGLALVTWYLRKMQRRFQRLSSSSSSSRNPAVHGG